MELTEYQKQFLAVIETIMSEGYDVIRVYPQAANRPGLPPEKIIVFAKKEHWDAESDTVID